LNIIDFLGEYEAICETALGRESGPSGGLFDEKTAGRKSHAIVPLKSIFHNYFGGFREGKCEFI
jgi:hypothetical protein